MILERTISTDTLAYRKMLSNRITTAPPRLRARTTLFSYRTGESKPMISFNKQAVKKADPLEDLEPRESSEPVVNQSEMSKAPETSTKPMEQNTEKVSRVFITEAEVPHRRRSSSDLLKRGRGYSINRSKSFGALSEKRMKLQKRKNTFKTFEDIEQRGQENLKEGIEVLRYPHKGDVFTRVGLRLNKYLCRPQEISKKDFKTGDAEFR